MITRAAYYFHAALYQLRQKPVLTAMMVCSLVFGVTALSAGIAVWRVDSSCPVTEDPSLPNVVLLATERASRGDLLIQSQSLQVGWGMSVAQTQSGSALSRHGAQTSCPCALIESQRARATWRRI
jgi:hypothetical protein